MSSLGKRRREDRTSSSNLFKSSKKSSNEYKQEDLPPNYPSEINLNFKNTNWDPQRKTRGQIWPKLKKIYQLENYDQYPPTTVTHMSIEAPVSVLPPKKYCDITGFEARYTYPSNGIRYANAEVYQWILQNLTTFESQQEVLGLRGAETRIK